MPTIEELKADHCPRCKQPGRQVDKRKLNRYDDVLLTYLCETESCAWFETGWVVQIDSRGNVFERDIGERGMDKTFPKMSNEALLRGKMNVEDYVGKRIEDDDQLPTSHEKPKEYKPDNG